MMPNILRMQKLSFKTIKLDYLMINMNAIEIKPHIFLLRSEKFCAILQVLTLSYGYMAAIERQTLRLLPLISILI